MRKSLWQDCIRFHGRRRDWRPCYIHNRISMSQVRRYYRMRRLRGGNVGDPRNMVQDMTVKLKRMTRTAYWAWGANAGLLVGYFLGDALSTPITVTWMVIANFAGIVLIILDTYLNRHDI